MQQVVYSITSETIRLSLLCLNERGHITIFYGQGCVESEFFDISFLLCDSDSVNDHGNMNSFDSILNLPAA